MIKTASAGTALRLLCLPLALTALASCQRHQTSQAPATETYQAPGRDGGQQEMDELIAATKRHPSLQAGSKEAGTPVKVDPYPHSADMSHDEHGGHGSQASSSSKPQR
ncbi:MAG TPA: hypothetical protein VFR92_02105 [Sphingomicrobium sp.]|jgi:hypothetical protein|nr:hypothetical protein [Sphingomicrobium sp.]